MTHLEDFRQRATEMGLSLKFTLLENENRYRIEISKDSHTTTLRRKITEDWHMMEYALIGLASHFVYRKWAEDISYMYIMKNVIYLTFTPESSSD